MGPLLAVPLQFHVETILKYCLEPVQPRCGGLGIAFQDQPVDRPFPPAGQHNQPGISGFQISKGYMRSVKPPLRVL